MEKTKKNIVSFLLIAAVVTALMGTAVAVMLSRIHVAKQKVEGDTEAIFYEAIDEGPIDLGDWYPTRLPEGFEPVYISDKQGDFQMVGFENEAGDELEFTFAKAGSGSVTLVDETADKSEVIIGNSTGLYFETPESETLFWTLEERGIGFVLRYVGTERIDIIDIAESVTEQETALVSTNQPSTEMALEKLGNYEPTALPDGYTLIDTTGNVSNSEGQGDQYVWRIYSDTEGREIRLTYNELPDGTDITVSEMTAAYRDMAGFTTEEVEIQGYDGCMIEDEAGGRILLWIDTDQHLMFTLTAPGLPLDEIIKIGNSILGQ